MIISPREKAMLALVLLAVLYGVLGLTLRSRLAQIQLLRATQHEQQALLADRDTLIAQRAEWEDQYAKLQNLMPVFEPGRRVDTYWLAIRDKLASKNSISILRSQSGEERQVGDVYELPIECKDWEGSLEGLVGFLYDLHAEGAMLDVRSMFIRPTPNKPALLRGSFTLYCAYLRHASATTSPGETKP